MKVDLPITAFAIGFVNEPVGTHSSRTLMLRELAKVLAVTRPATSKSGIRTAAVEANVVEKPTAAGREKTFRHLREFYGMDPELEVFRALRIVWEGDQADRPLVAALCAMARDPVFRATAAETVRLPIGAEAHSILFAKAVADAFPGHYSVGVQARIGRNIASSWTQSGHLKGRARKQRRRVSAGPVSLAYAMYLGHLTGLSGTRLFDTVWTSILDLSRRELESLAGRASRQGWIDYRASGGMVDVTFRLFEEGRAA